MLTATDLFLIFFAGDVVTVRENKACAVVAMLCLFYDLEVF